MSRLHSSNKGRAGSKKPELKIKPAWVKYKPDEIEGIIEKLAKEGKQMSMIGLILRDVYGVPNVKTVINKSLKEVLAKKGFKPKIPEDLSSLIKRAVNVRKHLENNKKDLHSTRGLQLIESKIKRLVKYYKRKGVLPSDWIYTPEKGKLLVE